ncbi:ATP-binding cassette domain-containing protein [Arthrobacter sp. ERGS1:01]|uniref:ATP-binding cassette domain-containing protein n=1 Tax=Arthrobacter sp. ERGS1:01 TaxID=1704044 RepID=UPI0006B5C9E9|nr:ABC transporter ATP-binding protein [Arthrobacter sp. ERGS1:01]
MRFIGEFWEKMWQSAAARCELIALLKMDRWRSLMLALLSTVTAIAPGATALATGWLASVLTRPSEVTFAAVTGPLTALAALLIAQEVAQTLRFSLATGISAVIDAAIRSRVRLGFQDSELSMIESAAYGDNASRASELANLNGFVRSPGQAATQQLMFIFRIAAIVSSAAVVAHFSWWLAMGMVAAGLVTRSFALRSFMQLGQIRDGREMHRRRADYWADLGTDPGAGKEVRMFGLGSWVAGRRRDEMGHYLRDVTEARKSMFRVNWILAVPRTLAAAAALLLPGLAVANGEVGISVMVQTFVAGLAVLSYSHLGSEAMQISFGLKALAAMNKMTDSFGPSTATQATEAEPETATARNGVVVRGISYTYPQGAREVFKDFSLTIQHHQVLAVVGRNGIGKTTLIKLLTGLYRPDSGAILAGGSRLDGPARARWQRRCAVVFQDFNRYPMSLADNVAMEAPEHRADADGIMTALGRANARHLVEALPNGLDTILSRQRSGGTDLSGGQWQKIALARALFAVAHGRDFLVLDEPTAQLDVQAEADFYENLVEAVRGRATVVLISHRLSTVRPADRIVVLDAGGVAEDGTHDELMDDGGNYAAAFALQAHRFTAEAPADTESAKQRSSNV